MHRPGISDKVKLLAGYVVWWLAWIGIQSMVLNRIGFSLRLSVVDGAVSMGILSLCGYAINTSLRFYKPLQIVRYIFSWSVGMTVFSAFVQTYVLKKILSDDAGYILFLQQSVFARGIFDFLMIAFITLTSWLWFNAIEQQENEKQKQHIERLAREAELSNLRLQLQPHFLFNSLNSISSLIGTNPEQARTMVQQLSDFLRGTVRKEDRQLVSLEEEIAHLHLYLEIEKIRFGHRLAIRLETSPESLPARLPSLLLQPIVENAIKFGLYDTIGEITISIITSMENNRLVVEITNPFDPATARPRKGTGFGLNSIQRRLYLMYAQNDLLETHQENELFKTLIKIPQIS